MQFMELHDILKERILVLDGAMGTMLQARGLRGGEVPEALNLTHPDVVRAIHAEYAAAGADVITIMTKGWTSARGLLTVWARAC